MMNEASSYRVAKFVVCSLYKDPRLELELPQLCVRCAQVASCAEAGGAWQAALDALQQASDPAT